MRTHNGLLRTLLMLVFITTLVVGCVDVMPALCQVTPEQTYEGNAIRDNECVEQSDPVRSHRWSYGYIPAGRDLSDFRQFGDPTVSTVGTAPQQRNIRVWGGEGVSIKSGAVDGPNGVVQPDGLYLYPNGRGTRAAIAWTAPTNGRYRFKVAFKGIDTGCHCIVHVVYTESGGIVQKDYHIDGAEYDTGVANIYDVFPAANSEFAAGDKIVFSVENMVMGTQPIIQAVRLDVYALNRALHLTLGDIHCDETIGQGHDSIWVEVLAIRNDGISTWLKYPLGEMNDSGDLAKKHFGIELMPDLVIKPGESYTVDVALMGRSLGTLLSHFGDAVKAIVGLQIEAVKALGGHPQNAGDSIDNMWTWYFSGPADHGEIVHKNLKDFAINSQVILTGMFNSWHGSPFAIGTIRLRITNVEGQLQTEWMRYQSVNCQDAVGSGPQVLHPLYIQNGDGNDPGDRRPAYSVYLGEPNDTD